MGTDTHRKDFVKTQGEGLTKPKDRSDAAANPEMPKVATTTHQTPRKGKTASSPTGF